jgi:hypothetical protein
LENHQHWAVREVYQALLVPLYHLFHDLKVEYHPLSDHQQTLCLIENLI